jgi:hypothetical protein
VSVLFRSSLKKNPASLRLCSALAALVLLGACTEVEGDPLAWIGPGIEKPGEQKTGDGTNPPVAAGPIDPFMALQPYQPVPGGTLGTLGFNLETYFDEPVDDTEERIERIEKALVAIHNDLKIMGPALQNLGMPARPVTPVDAILLPVIPSEPVPLIRQDLQTPPPIALPPTPAVTVPTPVPSAPQPVAITPPVATPAPVVAPPIAPAPTNSEALLAAGKTQAKPAPVTNTGGAAVSNIRIGEHPDRIRIVFDVTAPTNYTADLDNTENLLVIDLPGAAWNAAVTQNFNLPILKSYKADAANGGNIVVMQLSGPTEILAQSKMPAVAGGGQRIVIDLKK